MSIMFHLRILIFIFLVGYEIGAQKYMILPSFEPCVFLLWMVDGMGLIIFFLFLLSTWMDNSLAIALFLIYINICVKQTSDGFSNSIKSGGGSLQLQNNLIQKSFKLILCWKSSLGWNLYCFFENEKENKWNEKRKPEKKR